MNHTIKFRSTQVVEKDIEIKLLDEVVTYWKITKKYEPYNVQYVRVVREDKSYKLMVLYTAYSDFSIKFHKLYIHDLTYNINIKCQFVDKSLLYLNSSIASLLYCDAKTVSDETVEQINVDKFNEVLNEFINHDLKH